jgi:hypothetical protein
MVDEPATSHRAPVALVVLLMVAGVVAALGGLRESPARLRRQLALGQSIDTAQWRVRPMRAWIGERCPLAGPARVSPPSPSPSSPPCLSVEMELTNRTDASSSDIADALVIADPRLPARARPELMLARDRGPLFQLHPRMPERIVASWKLPAGSLPRAATLVIRGKRFKERDNLIGGEGWFYPTPVAEARLPLVVEVEVAP